MWKKSSGIVLLLALLAVTLPGIAYTPGGASAPECFETYDELDRWAKSTARYGGALRVLGPEDQHLYYAERHHDRDRLSAESAVYRCGGSRRYELVLYLPARHFTGRDARVEGDTLVLSQWSYSLPDTFELRVPLAMLPGYRASSSPGRGMMDFGDSLSHQDESGVEISRDQAMDIARSALLEEKLLVGTLRLRESSEWGVVWRVQSWLPKPHPGMDSSGRVLVIDANSGEVVQDLYFGTVTSD